MSVFGFSLVKLVRSRVSLIHSSMTLCLKSGHDLVIKQKWPPAHPTGHLRRTTVRALRAGALAVNGGAAHASGHVCTFVDKNGPHFRTCTSSSLFPSERGCSGVQTPMLASERGARFDPNVQKAHEVGVLQAGNGVRFQASAAWCMTAHLPSPPRLASLALAEASCGFRAAGS